MLLGAFLGLVGWFGTINVYHHHFFDSGLLVAAYNLCRLGFVAILAWLIYVVGYAAIASVTPAARLLEFSLAERLVFGFGTGIGIWHAVMLVLGLLGLYYRFLMICLCFVVLCLSVKHFGAFISDVGQSIARRAAAWSHGKEIRSGITGLLILLAVAWLALVRGLYPGGGGDYYTHYFYYYHDVIRNHGLTPNDVWYQYLLFKGRGVVLPRNVVDRPAGPRAGFILLGSFWRAGARRVDGPNRAKIAVARRVRRALPDFLYRGAGETTVFARW